MTTIAAKKDTTGVIGLIKFYIDKIVSDPTIGGMKALLLDSVTTKIVSMVYSQTQILEKEVYLIEQLGKSHESMGHLKAAVFVQPTEDNFKKICAELSEPKFKEYHLFFSNIVPSDMLTQLGRLDEHEVILQVHEYFADYLSINEDFFHLGIENSLILSSPLSRTLESAKIFDRNVNGVLSILLSMKRRPTQIRYQAASELTRRMASDVITQIEKENDLFEFRRQEGLLLLILDRKDDPITPLLTQWTYQAMVHELLGLHNNRVVLKGAPNITKELEEVVLSVTQDDFFAKHRYSNFGDLGLAIKGMLVDYQKVAKVNENISSIEDMQAFLERYPAFRSKSINVSKHVALMSELGRLIDVCQLFDISQLEQDIACRNDHSAHKQELMMKLRNPKVKFADKLRLVLLFLIRYENYDEGSEFRTVLSSEKASNSQQLALLDAIIDYAGDTRRAQGLFSEGGLISKIGKIAFSMNDFQSQNVYTQHQPVLYYILDSIAKGKLKDSTFPMVSSSTVSLSNSSSNSAGRYNEVVIFMMGGSTFEEATKVAEFNAANPSMKVILGGSCVHNSRSFLTEISKVFGK